MRPGTIILALLILALLPSTGCQNESTRLAEHKRRADAYLDAAKHAEAIIEYKSVLQIDPNHAAAHHGLARAYLASRELSKAYWELQETVRLDPDNTEARLQYAEFLLFGEEGEFEQAVEQADAILATHPQRTEAHLLRARALQALGRNEEARASYEKAVEIAPNEAGPLLLLARHHDGRGSRAMAEPLFRRLTEVEPTFRSFNVLAGFLAADRLRDEETEAVYRKAIELAGEEERSTAVQTLASFYYSRERFDESEQLLRQAIDGSEADLDLIYALARFYTSRGETAQADAMIEEATRAAPGDVQTHLTLSAYRGNKGDLEGALAAAEAALAVDPRNRPARLRKAELLVDLGYRKGETGRIAEGRSIVDAILAKEPREPEALFVRAKIEMAEGHLERTLSSLRRALDVRPDWPQAHFVLGSAMLASGDRTGARVELVRALEIDPNLVEARHALAQVHASLGEYELASEQGLRVLRERPEDHTMRIVVAQSLVGLRRLDEALNELLAIPDAARDASAEYAIGRVYVMRGEPDLGRVHLVRAADLAPKSAEILEALLRIDAAQGRIEDVTTRIDAALQKDPDSGELLQIRGLAQLASGQPEAAEESLRQAITADPNDVGAYQQLAKLLGRAGRVEEMVGTYEKALAARPDSASLHLLVGMLREGMGDVETALERYEEAVRKDSELAPAKNNLAYLLAERGEDLDRALDLAQEARSLLPDNPNAADTLGWVLLKKNIPSAAIGYLKEAEGGLDPEDPALGIVRQHLALAYEADGQEKKAWEVIERALADYDASGTGGENEKTAPEEPTWVAELRALRNRLEPPAEPPAS
jgi:tetratricopeptide (TPR) repeat protein